MITAFSLGCPLSQSGLIQEIFLISMKAFLMSGHKKRKLDSPKIVLVSDRELRKRIAQYCVAHLPPQDTELLEMDATQFLAGLQQLKKTSAKNPLSSWRARTWDYRMIRPWPVRRKAYFGPETLTNASASGEVGQ
jgi:hypothetical protein